MRPDSDETFGRTAPLCGREDELRRLTAALDHARGGEPAFVLIDGPGGIGKTALIRHFVDAQDDVRVLWAAGDVSERTVPYAVADQLVRRAQLADLTPPVVAGSAAHYTGVGFALLELFGELQRTGPAVVIIDDAHWADPASLRALLFAVRRLVGDAVLVILAARTDDLHLLPDGFSRIAASVRVTLGPLQLDDARTLVRQRDLPLSAHILGRVFDLSAGVPLHLCALLDELSARGDFGHVTTPRSYAALIVGRLSECSEPSRRLVEAAAVVGRRNASIDEVAGIAGVKEEDALTAVAEAVDRDLIRVADRSIEFVHPLVRSAIHEAIPPARLAELHTAAAASVDEPGVALRHRARAAIAPDERLAAELALAGEGAAEDGNWLRAADFFGEAAQLSTARADRERRVLDSVSALSDAGDLVAARSMLGEIRGYRVVAERDHVLGRLALSELDLPEAERKFQAAWDACPEDGRSLRMRIASELAYCAYFRVDARTQLMWSQRAAELAPPGAAPRITALALALNGRLGEGLAALDDAVLAPEPSMVRGRLRLIDDDLAGARADLVGARLAAIRGPSRAAAMSHGRLSMLEYLEGHWPMALTYAEQGLAACVDRTDVAQITAVRAPAVLVLAGQGAWTEAEHHLRAMEAEASDIALPRVYTAYAGARLAAARGDATAVLSALEPILALPAREAVDEPGVWPWQDLYADALVDLGRLEEAERFLAPHEQRAGERGRRSMIGRLARSRARLEAALGNPDRAEEAFERSTDALAAVPLPYELGLTELDHGRFLRRRRRRRAAVEVLADARDRFSALGAAPALAACERELQASGLAPKRPAAKGLARLTPQESTVARLVVDGMTNREIAGELLVSTKTIEVHLTSVYAKLEVASRAELRGRARRGELKIQVAAADH